MYKRRSAIEYPFSAGTGKTLTHNEFLQRLYFVRGTEYTPIDEYIKSNIKIKFIHNQCKNTFLATPNQMLHKNSKILCPIFANINRGNCNRKNIVDVIDQLNKKYNNKYKILYPNKYKSNKDLLDIQCTCGNIFTASMHNLMRGHGGCNVCKSTDSRNVKLIKELLHSKNCYNKKSDEYFYINEYKFDDLRNIRPLKFDFAIFKNNKLLFIIEYDGEFHFSNRFSSNNYLLVQKYDAMKDDYCKQNNIPLVRLNYKTFNREYIKQICSKFNE